MRKIKMLRRPVSRAAACAVILSTLLISAAGAYLAVSKTLTNTFSTGSVNIEITEPGVDPADVPWGAAAKPVFVNVAADSVTSVVKVTLVPVVKDASGNIVRRQLGGLSVPNSSFLVMGDFTLRFNSDWEADWLYRDGSFYYKKTVAPGGSTAQILYGIELTDDTPEKRAEYAGLTVEINVIAEALQASGGAPAEWGLTVDASGNVTFV